MKIPKSVAADAALVFITLIWASTFAIVKQCLGQISPVYFIVLRFWIAALAMVVILPGALRGISLQTLRRGLSLSALLTAGFIFQTLGLRETTPSRCAFITSLSVLLVPLLGFLLIRYRPRKQTLCGVVLATAGLALLTLNPGELTISKGDSLTLLCAVAFALHILLLGRWVLTSDHRQLAVLQVAGTAVVTTLVMPVLETRFVSWSATLVVYLLATGAVATAFACYVQISAQRFTTANRAALVFSLEPFFAALFSYLLLGQTLSGKEWLGGTLVLAGIVTSEIRRDNPPAFTPSKEGGVTREFQGPDKESTGRLEDLEPVAK
ncbi:MAG TPA: DMT family transporter [Acidobacteriota bacterium]|nr:DMT family transporter [Acidobacteriota bacterium]